MSAVPAVASSAGLTSAHFAAHLSQRTHLPVWWLEAKKEAWNQFNALPLPTRSDERWRFSDLKGLTVQAIELDETTSAPEPVLPNFPRSAEIIFSNRAVTRQTTLPDVLAKKGVIFAPLEEALLKHGDRIRPYFQKHPVALGSEKFVALNTAFASTGAILLVPKGVEIAEPFAVYHSAIGTNNSLFPHTLVVLEDHAKATLVEFFSSTDATAHFVSGVNDLHAGNGATLTYVGTQNWSPTSLAFQTNSIVAERDARVLSLNIHLGGRQTRHESRSRLLGPGAHSEMLALTIASGSQQFDQRTLQTHVAPHTSSNLLYKNVLLDTARTVFSGLIVVEPEAQKTDAYQSNRNLMLSDNAEANSLPGLEIQANDVRCTHGATSSRIEPEQEFYLESRGIPPAQAHELLVFGFFEEVLAKLENEPLHDALRALIETKFKK